MFWIAYWIGLNVEALGIATALAILSSIVVLYPLRCNKKLFWNLIIAIWFLAFAWRIYHLASGSIYLLTSNARESTVMAFLIALFPAITPLIISLLLKEKSLKWAYAIAAIIVSGCAIPFINSIYSTP